MFLDAFFEFSLFFLSLSLSRPWSVCLCVFVFVWVHSLIIMIQTAIFDINYFGCSNNLSNCVSGQRFSRHHGCWRHRLHHDRHFSRSQHRRRRVRHEQMIDQVGFKLQLVRFVYFPERFVDAPVENAEQDEQNENDEAA